MVVNAPGHAERGTSGGEARTERLGSDPFESSQRGGAAGQGESQRLRRSAHHRVATAGPGGIRSLPMQSALPGSTLSRYGGTATAHG